MKKARKKHRTPVVITKKGKPVAKPVLVTGPASVIFGCMAGTVEFVGDIESPVLPPSKKWNAGRGKFV